MLLFELQNTWDLCCHVSVSKHQMARQSYIYIHVQSYRHIFQVLVPRRRVLVGDVIARHTLSASQAYPDRRVCVRSSMIGLKLFVDVINQSESTPIR
jgi:hypothetical protein